jgi:hypothetical protein
VEAVMETVLLMIWWIGLIGALPATLVLLKRASLVIGALRDIHRLAVVTAGAAGDIGGNLEAVPRLAALTDATAGLPEAARRLAAAAGLVEGVLAGLGGHRSQRG